MILLGVLFLVALSVGCYWNSLEGLFVFDDIAILESLKPLAYKRGEAGTWRGLLRLPVTARSLTFWTYQRDLLAHGVERTTGWHARNVALHSLNAVLTFAVLAAIFPIGAAIIGAAIATVHPVSTAAVASIAGRSSVLCATFYLGSLFLVALGGWWLVGIGLLAWGGLRSKEEYVAIVPAALALWWFL